jgi:pyridoxamine 5'-phosphate oxidase
MSAPIQSRPLRAADLDPDPIAQFAAWFEQARETGMTQPEAVAVATATPGGAPSARMVLMKHFGQDGFVFFTNYDGRKGRELAANPQAALLFHWEILGRQVRIEGPVEPVSREETAAYVRARPRGSQLSALASPQSEPIESRAWLEERVRELDARYGDGNLPVPERWGGYRVAPRAFEFWQHREDRLHDRFLYTPTGGGWRIQRLAP